MPCAPQLLSVNILLINNTHSLLINMSSSVSSIFLFLVLNYLESHSRSYDMNPPYPLIPSMHIHDVGTRGLLIGQLRFILNALGPSPFVFTTSDHGWRLEAAAGARRAAGKLPGEEKSSWVSVCCSVTPFLGFKSCQCYNRKLVPQLHLIR